jgi:hypothetical protein
MSQDRQKRKGCLSWDVIDPGGARGSELWKLSRKNLLRVLIQRVVYFALDAIEPSKALDIINTDTEFPSALIARLN